jgi:REP element-mobilizing transposase RayT
MARPLRLEFPGAVYHVTSRGNARQAIFLDKDDRESFLGILSLVAARFNWLCHAYCLMKLIITYWSRPWRNLNVMRQLNGVIPRLLIEGIRGRHLFLGRYKGDFVKEAHLLSCVGMWY